MVHSYSDRVEVHSYSDRVEVVAPRDRDLMRLYSLTREDYDRMDKEQGGCCRICELPFGEGGYQREVDHCHSCGAVRALLCSHCNSGLGRFHDRPRSLARAIVYLLDNPCLPANDNKEPE